MCVFQEETSRLITGVSDGRRQENVIVLNSQVDNPFRNVWERRRITGSPVRGHVPQQYEQHRVTSAFVSGLKRTK